MTEKRFILTESFNFFSNVLFVCKDYINYMTVNETIDLLNSLSEENEQLKNSGQYWYDEHKRIVNNYVEKIKEVEKENEQLKLDLKVANDGADLYKDINEALEKENEQLKSELGKLNILYKAKCKTEEQLIEMSKEVGKENEQLKQQLIDVDKLIDDKIKEYQKYDGYDTEKFYIGTQLLKELKKEIER